MSSLIPSQPANEWQLIDSGSGSPDYNMRKDNEIFRSLLSGGATPILRLYSWDSPALSLGKFQKPAEILNLRKCKENGVVIVKRITGGSVIYHSPDELTYSLVCHSNFFGRISVKESYRKITSFLIEFYRRIGLEASYAKHWVKQTLSGSKKADFCFSRWQDYDILIKGKKVGGNAQKRNRNVIFQHGSIPFKLPDNLEDYFLSSESSRNKYSSLSDLGIKNFSNLKKILINSFENSFSAKLIVGCYKKGKN